MLESIKRWGSFILISGIILFADQWVKQRVTQTLAVGASWEPIPAIAGIVRITRSQNAGAAFGMFPFASDFFLALALITIVAFIISYPRLPSHAWLSRLSIALITGGALSNAVDRLLYGHVVDYFHVQLSPSISNVSNFADHAITLGVILLLIDQWRAERRELAEKQAQEELASEQTDLPSDGENPEDSPSPDVLTAPDTRATAFDEPSEMSPANDTE